MKNISELPIDILTYLSVNYLSPDSIISVASVSKTWNKFFSSGNVWQNKIYKHLNIKPQILQQLPFQGNPKIFFRNIYLRLLRLQQNYPNLPRHVQLVYNRKNRDLLLVCCTDDANFALEKTPIEEHDTLLHLALYAGCSNIPKALFEEKKEEGEYFLGLAVKSCRLTLIKYLTHAENNFIKLPTYHDYNELVYDAIKGNRPDIIDYLLDPQNKFGLKPNYEMLYQAAKNGNIKTLDFLIKKYNLIPNFETLHAGALSGNLELVRYLLIPENNFNLFPDVETLGLAVSSGNFELIMYLLDPNNNFNLVIVRQMISVAAKRGDLLFLSYVFNSENKLNCFPDQEILVLSASSGNDELVKYLLDPKNKFNLKPNKIVLENAVYSGNLALVRYLLDPENNFLLQVGHEILNLAAQSGNIDLVKYLLDPENGFGLYPTQQTVKNAVKSANLDLVKYLLDPKYNLSPNIDNLIYFNENFEVLYYLLSPENNFGLKPTPELLIEIAISGNLEFVRYLLNPENEFQIMLTSSLLYLHFHLMPNKGISDSLLPSVYSMQNALEKIAAGEFSSATKSLLESSFRLCPNYFFKVANYFLDNSNLNEESKTFLATNVKEKKDSEERPVITTFSLT